MGRKLSALRKQVKAIEKQLRAVNQDVKALRKDLGKKGEDKKKAKSRSKAKVVKPTKPATKKVSPPKEGAVTKGNGQHEANAVTANG